MIFCSLIVAILWAGTAVIPSSVRNYFRVQVVYTVLVWPTALLFGDKSTAYLIVFALMTLLVLLFCGAIIMDFLESNPLKWFAVTVSLFFGALLTAMAMIGLERKMQAYDYVGFAEAGLLASYASMLSLATRYVSKRKRLIAVTLAVLWLLEAAFGYGYYMSYGSQFWERQNWFTPAYLLIAGFSFLGWKLRQREYVLNI